LFLVCFVKFLGVVEMKFAERESSELVSNFRGQGTIEYLVIIAIVVVIALVVVGLLVSQMDSSQGVSGSSFKIGGLTQSIGVTESLVSPADGNFAVRLLNNSGDTITVSNVKVGDANASFSEDMAQGGSKFFTVNAGSVCEEGKVVSSSVVITYVTSDGLTKKMVYPAQVLFDCTPYTIAQANLADQCPSCGSSCSGGAQSLSADSVDVNAGCYTATDLNVVDSDLVGSNILTGYTIFGVAGSASAGSSVPLYANLGSGQTSCWDVGGSVISCSTSTTYPGMDGNVYGASYTHVWSSTTNTMLDLNTGLRWQKADNGSAVTWQAALQYCSTLSLDGYTSGWRLPTFSEISGMYNFQSGGCITGFSPCNHYWSSTSVPSYPSNAYYLYTDYGYINSVNKNYVNLNSARCVRFEN